MTIRRLVLVRHAQAVGFAATDHDRELTEAGRAEARSLGGRLAADGLAPDRAFVSGALRARSTWEEVRRSAGWDVEPDTSEAWYGVSPEAALDLIRLVPDGTGTLLVLGHNPTIASLASLLDDGEGDADAGARMVMGFPPAAAAVFEVGVPWADLGPASASVRAFHRPDDASG